MRVLLVKGCDMTNVIIVGSGSKSLAAALSRASIALGMAVAAMEAFAAAQDALIDEDPARHERHLLQIIIRNYDNDFPLINLIGDVQGDSPKDEYSTGPPVMGIHQVRFRPHEVGSCMESITN